MVLELDMLGIGSSSESDPQRRVSGKLMLEGTGFLNLIGRGD
jgi:hypothetical protein